MHGSTATAKRRPRRRYCSVFTWTLHWGPQALTTKYVVTNILIISVHLRDSLYIGKVVKFINFEYHEYTVRVGARDGQVWL